MLPGRRQIELQGSMPEITVKEMVDEVGVAPEGMIGGGGFVVEQDDLFELGGMFELLDEDLEFRFGHGFKRSIGVE